MKKNKNMPESLITELAFDLIRHSASIEGFGLDITTVDVLGDHSKVHVDGNTILAFLSDEYTKVSIDFKGNDSYLIAHNSISNESIRIRGLADHYLALIDAVYCGNETWKARKIDSNTPLLSHELIKHINFTHQRYREGEVGIADYRGVRLDGQPHEVHISSWMGDMPTKVTSLNLAKARDVEKKMTELINWVNTEAFRNNRDIFRDLAEFHARFVKIHPFGDGNGRTARLLTNYLLIALGQAPITIPPQHKDEYCNALNYANSEDLELSTRELNGFAEFLCEKFGLECGSPVSYHAIDSGRTDDNKYRFIADFLRGHQITKSAKECVGEILNNYGMKNNTRIKTTSGKLRAELIIPSNNFEIND